ncbi:MAG: hypothetical protein EP330_17950 [Deltaproteobacteria bacterium]|nr:MAG: hypothetical protein EP330_17950 [Deltaproteobacteria bacterium]
MDLYRCQDVADVADLYAGTEESVLGAVAVREVVARRAVLLAAGIRQGHPGASVVRRNFPSPDLDPSDEADACELVARSLWFVDLDAVGEQRLDPWFERAADAVVGGEVEKLRDLLDALPELASARSSYGHRATLLHYVAANGVQIRRQTVHRCTPAVASLLLERGASSGATMAVYGGELTVHELLHTSAHPAEAGLTEAIDAVLRRYPA